MRVAEVIGIVFVLASCIVLYCCYGKELRRHFKRIERGRGFYEADLEPIQMRLAASDAYNSKQNAKLAKV
jgi:hypothetical protein